MVTFTIGELFSSFSDLQQKLSEYSERKFCHFYIKDSKKLTSDEVVNPDIIYKHIVYNCIYGGQKARFRGSGTRSVTSIRHGCNASLYLRVTKDRTHLQVRSFSEAHNHDVTEELYRSAAQDKKLPEDLKAEIEELLLLGADKDRLVDYIRYVSRKNLDKKNLFNIYDTAIKQQREISRDRAIMLLQKAYAVDTEEEAEQILQNLLQASRPVKRSRAKEVDSMENVQVTYYNEGDDSQGEVLEGTDPVDESLQRLMGTFSGPDGERIVIVQQEDDPIEVIEAENSLEVSEYLEDDMKEVLVKQELIKDGSEGENEAAPRYLTLKDLSRSFTSSRKRPLAKGSGKNKGINSSYVHGSEDTVIYEEPAVKTRIVSQAYDHSEDVVIEGLNEIKIEKIKAEHEKLLAETEMLRTRRNNLVKDISRMDVEKNKLYLEIDLIKQKKKYIEAKSTWLQNDSQTKELKNEKLKLEIAKLKYELNEN